MKIIDKLISFIFDLVIIVIASTILLVTFDIVQYEVIEGLLTGYLFNPSYEVIVGAAAVIVILLALKVTVFTSSLSSKTKKNIMVDTPHGKIQIAQSTIEGIAKNVIKDYPQVKDVQAAMTKARNGINMYMALVVYQGINIKDTITKVQYDVKTQIESTTSVYVNKIDVKIKNVLKIDKALVNQEKKIKEASIEEIEKKNDLTETLRNETEITAVNSATESNEAKEE